MTLSDERLEQLRGYWQDFDNSPIAEQREVAAALRELQAARSVIGCHCPRCEGKYWVEHQCPVS